MSLIFLIVLASYLSERDINYTNFVTSIKHTFKNVRFSISFGVYREQERDTRIMWKV